MATLCCDPVGDDGEGGCQRAGRLSSVWQWWRVGGQVSLQ